MSNTVERFSNRVENYVKYRPDYPKEVLQLFKTEMNLQKTSLVADIGAGTGISARIFLENGNRVFGVEPNAAMRAAAENFLKDFPNFKSINGTAEHTMLGDGSIDFIVAAQAFHWFDKENARKEFKRILKDKGYIALLWNERQLDSNDFLRDYERFLIEFGTDYQHTRHDNISEKLLRDFFQKDFSHKSFPNVQTLDFAGLRGRVLSASYMPSEENETYKPMIDKLQCLFADYEKESKIEILYTTNIYYAQI
ncbi:MAG: class I SAM-dependent methyltransferase [Acidobacteriota bacterium]|nr:class I SAM-dependent methyltransferase [Acidobacteriota bacterium]